MFSPTPNWASWSTRRLFELMTAAASGRSSGPLRGQPDDRRAGRRDRRRPHSRSVRRNPPETGRLGSPRAECGGDPRTTCYLVHLSRRRPPIRSVGARRGSPAVYGEVCLHHLLLDDRCYRRRRRALPRGPAAQPPGHPEALWQALADGTLTGGLRPLPGARTAGSCPTGGATATGSRASGRASRCCRVAGPGPASAARRGRLRQSGPGVRPLSAQGVLAPSSDADC